MNNIILDTNILHQEGFESRNIKLLMRLSLANSVNIYIPEIIKREFITRRVSESTEKLQQSHNKLSFVLKKIKKENILYRHITDTLKSIKEIESKINNEINIDFDSWVNECKAKIIPFEVECMDEVLNDYFLGKGVYRKVKSREDIPDAIINSGIIKLLKEKGKITVIIKDGQFKKHLNSISGISVLDSVEEFLTESSNKDKLAELDSTIESIDLIKMYFSGSEFTEYVLKFLISSKNTIEEIYIEEDQISSSENLEMSSFGETVNYPVAKSISDFHMTNVAWLSEGQFSLEVEFITTARLDYCAGYGDYLEFSDDTERAISLDSMNGEGICDLSELRDLKFTGYIKLSIENDVDIDIETIKEHSQNLGADSNPIKLEIEIEHVVVL